MDVYCAEYPNEFYRTEQVKLQITEQKLVEETFSQNEINRSQCIHNVPPDRPVQAEFCQKVISAFIKIIVFTDTILTSLFPEFLSKVFVSVDIEVTEHQNEESLIQSIHSDNSITHFIIIKSTRHVQRLLDRTHKYGNVHSVYLECAPSELKFQRRLARNYSKLDAVFDDPHRLLINLIMDIALFCEETADRQRDEASSMKAAQKNYQRCMDLYAVAETLI